MSLSQEEIAYPSDSIDLEQLVISASRVTQLTPVSFQNISKIDIESIYVGQDPVLLIQSLTPSIMSYSDGGTDIGNYSQFRLRGIDQDRLNISLNGVPLNDMVDHGTYFSNFSDFGNSVESIQIVRGVGSNSAGVASYGGSVNFESPNLFNERADGEVQLTIGSFGTLRTAAEVNTGRMDNNVGIYTRLTRTVTDGYKFNSGSESYSLFFSGGQIGDHNMFKVTAFAGKTQNGQSYEHVPKSIIEQEPRTNYNNLNDVDDFEQNRVQLQYAHAFKGDLALSSSVYYNGAGGVFPYTFDGVQYMYGLENDHFGLQAALKKNILNSNLTFGINAYRFERTNFEYVSPFVTEPYARDFTDKNEISAFVKYENNMGRFNIYSNLELRNIDMAIMGDESIVEPFNIVNSYTFLNGTVGINYQLDSDNQLYASFGQSSREPTRSDIFNGVTQDERVSDIEFGYRFKNQLFELDANLFYLNFDNEIVKIGALQDFSYIEIRQNVENSIRSGFELISRYSISSDFQLGLLASIMSSNIDVYEDGNSRYENVEHIFMPKFILQPSIDIGLSNDLAFRLSGRYSSESFTELSNNDDFVLPSFFVIDSQLSYAVGDNISAKLVVNNIFNELYFTEGSPIDADFDGAVEELGLRIQSPQHMYIMLAYKF